MKELEIWVSVNASRLNEQDHVDFKAFAEQAVANGGDAYMSYIYHAHVDGDRVFIRTYGEEEV